MKTFLHPGFLKFLAGQEIPDGPIFIVTEPIQPLYVVLEEERAKIKTESDRSKFIMTLQWGFHQIIKAISFLHERKLVHGNVNIDSIFVNRSGDWKLFGLDFLWDPSKCSSSAAAVTLFGPKWIPTSYHPPEGLSSASLGDTIDVYGFAMLIYEVFIGRVSGHPVSSLAHAATQSDVPLSLQPLLRQFASSNPRLRWNSGAGKFKSWDEVLRSCEFFTKSPFVRYQLVLEEFAVRDDAEREALVKHLMKSVDALPTAFLQQKVIPILTEHLQLGSFSHADALELVFAIVNASRTSKTSKLKSKSGDTSTVDEESLAWTQGWLAPLTLQLYKKPDRRIRLSLLKNVNVYVPILSESMVNRELFPLFATGYTDAAGPVREGTVKATVSLSSKLKESIISNEVVRALWKLQTDREPAIRTNCVICLGKITPKLSDSVRQKMLIPFFGRSMRDPFPKAREAAIMAIGVTSAFFTLEECVTKVIPSICPTLVAKDKGVRHQAFRCMDILMERLRKNAEQLDHNADADAEDDSSSAAGFMSWAISKISSTKEEEHHRTEEKKTPQTTEPVPELDDLQTSPTASVSGISPGPTGASAKVSQSHVEESFDHSLSDAPVSSSGWGLDDDLFADVSSSEPHVMPPAKRTGLNTKVDSFSALLEGDAVHTASGDRRVGDGWGDESLDQSDLLDVDAKSPSSLSLHSKPPFVPSKKTQKEPLDSWEEMLSSTEPILSSTQKESIGATTTGASATASTRTRTTTTTTSTGGGGGGSSDFFMDMLKEAPQEKPSSVPPKSSFIHSPAMTSSSKRGSSGLVAGGRGKSSGRGGRGGLGAGGRLGAVKKSTA
eukprot:TRINITY_DN1120_c0_g1_i3.p1 TRINITY_DN1120_c0_g1~~TRINITY_DN1120_c0_g1_i3.p1  ORF type:complete len:836 (+),score=245.77 TRINITY_DN1120_c0_g1_i3:549-3056(+)